MNDPTQMAVLSGFGLVGLIKGRKEDEGRTRARCSCGIEPVGGLAVCLLSIVSLRGGEWISHYSGRLIAGEVGDPVAPPARKRSRRGRVEEIAAEA